MDENQAKPPAVAPSPIVHPDVCGRRVAHLDDWHGLRIIVQRWGPAVDRQRCGIWIEDQTTWDLLATASGPVASTLGMLCDHLLAGNGLDEEAVGLLHEVLGSVLPGLYQMR